MRRTNRSSRRPGASRRAPEEVVRGWVRPQGLTQPENNVRKCSWLPACPRRRPEGHDTPGQLQVTPSPTGEGITAHRSLDRVKAPQVRLKGADVRVVARWGPF